MKLEIVRSSTAEAPKKVEDLLRTHVLVAVVPAGGAAMAGGVVVPLFDWVLVERAPALASQSAGTRTGTHPLQPSEPSRPASSPGSSTRSQPRGRAAASQPAAK